MFGNVHILLTKKWGVGSDDDVTRMISEKYDREGVLINSVLFIGKAHELNL